MWKIALAAVCYCKCVNAVRAMATKDVADAKRACQVRDHSDLWFRASGLNLLLAAIILWIRCSVPPDAQKVLYMKFWASLPRTDKDQPVVTETSQPTHLVRSGAPVPRSRHMSSRARLVEVRLAPSRASRG